MNNCLVCGIEINKNRKYCSRDCYNKMGRSDEHRKHISETLFRHTVKENTRKKISAKNKGHVHSTETKIRMSIAGKGHDNSRIWRENGGVPWNKGPIETKTCPICNNIFTIPVARQKQIRACSKECRNIFHAQAVKQAWKDPDKAEHMTKARIKNQPIKPNKKETVLINLLNELFPNEWKYNFGDIIIAGKVPDFININGHKAFIELSGCYFHGCPEHFPGMADKNNFSQKEKVYNEIGYTTLEVWEHELKYLETLKPKIISFVSSTVEQK